MRVSGLRLAAISIVLGAGVIAALMLLNGDDGSTPRDSSGAGKPARADTAADLRASLNQERGSTSAPPRDTQAADQPLSAPRLTATRSGGSAIIRYRYSASQWERLPAGAGLVLAVTGSEEGSLPKNAIFRLTRPSGQRRLGLPRSAGPYVVHAQTLAGEQAQGEPVTIRLR